MENALRDSEATFRAMFSISSVGKAQADAHSGKFVRVNAALSALTGYDESELLQRGFVDITHPDDWIRDCGGIRRLVSGEADKFDAETRYICKDGTTRWVRATLNLISNRGRPLRTTAVIQDISDRKNAEEQADVLLREVNHRAKNMLSVVLAIARHTANDDGSGLSARFEDRLRALAASQDVLVASGWKNVPISVLIRAQLAHFGDLLDSRILLSGPDLNITAQAAQTIGMALHELATNAAKYGALSNDKGRIEIAWHVRADSSGTERFGICWKESGGPQVVAPTWRGFGSTVLERVAKMSLRAEASVDYAATGLNWQLECPSNQLLAGATSTTPVRATDVPRHDSDKIRILLVEDEILPALEIATGLTDAGFEVLGPAGSVEEALRLLEQGCDAAVLDVNLGPVTSERVALLLGARGTPFISRP
jgi:PAS domain S-box-containing protein